MSKDGTYCIIARRLLLPERLNAQVHILSEPTETEPNIGKIVALTIDIDRAHVASGAKERLIRRHVVFASVVHASAWPGIE
jgi:hypothetical protein